MADLIWTFDALAEAAGATVDGTPGAGVTGVSIDTRTLAPGDLFVALQDVRDGHDFVEAAFDKGAVAALVRTDYARKPGDGVLLRAGDPLAALEAIGRAARARLSPDARVIAVTGSAGKTTTKEMLRACCARLGPTHASEKSYNNHWGVPLTLAKMPAGTRFAIFEIGMNHAGEITPLTKMVAPHVAVVTTVVSAHLEHFGTEEAIADAKAEIFLGLKPGGAAIMDFDNRHYARLSAAARAQDGVKVTPFSGRPVGDDQVMNPARTGHGIVQLRHAHEVDGQSLVTAHGQSYVLGAAGAHMVANSVAVVAVLKAIGADLGRALPALAEFGAPEGRGSRSRLAIGGGEILLINESYNANPASMRAALDAMRGIDRTAHPRRIAVLGEMLELGAEAARLHTGLNDAIDAAGIDLVFATGPNMKRLFDLLPEGKQGGWSETAAGLEEVLAGALRQGDAVMIKGSNGSRTWQLVAALKKRAAEATTA